MYFQLALFIAACGAPPEAAEPQAEAVPPDAAVSLEALDPAPTLSPDPGVLLALRSNHESVLEAQPWSRSSSQSFVASDGRPGTATLTDLAPAVGVWFVLSLVWSDGESQSWHLENSAGMRQSVRLETETIDGVVLARDGVPEPCALWGGEPNALVQAKASGHAYGQLCGGRLAVRNPTVGHKTTLEWTTDFLRDHVIGGERLTTLAKETLFADTERAEEQLGERGPSSPGGGPVPAMVSDADEGRLVSASNLGLPLSGAADGQVEVGGWYPVQSAAGVWASVLQPGAVAPRILARNAGRARELDPAERTSLVYTAAFDLSSFELGYELGTDHPRVGWSDRVPEAVHPQGVPGPDGFATLAPLTGTGLLNPDYVSREVAVFAGGFKRSHGAFSRGELSQRNAGSHYGFVEYGTVLSRLQPGLATLVVWVDGMVELRTWTEADDARLASVKHARQNGVPLLEPDPETGLARPGELVRDWGKGNWSGSVEGEQRTIRGGVCIQESAAGRFLLYSYFSTATPSSMAQVYDAYGCSYAMHLDMNALEHTYLAVHTQGGDGLTVNHLVRGMEVLDRESKGGTYARFVGYGDNRDFFYLLRKPRGPLTARE